MAYKIASVFDGSDYLRRGADWSNQPADSKLFTTSFWFKSSYTSDNQDVWSAEGSKAYVELNTSGEMWIILRQAADNQGINAWCNSGKNDGAWHHFMCSFDLADAGKRHLYVDGASELNIGIYDNVTLDYTRSNHSIGEATWSGRRWNGSLCEVYILPGVYVDLSIAANRALFYVGGKAPLVAGTGLGTPIYYSESANATNNGNGGALTLYGTLTTENGPEIVPSASIDLMKFMGAMQ